MKKLTVLFAALMLTGLCSAVAFSADSMSWTGEVLDLGCYAKGQHGASHASCAVTCLEKGGAMGLLVDGEVVKVDTEASNADAVKLLKSLGGKNATVTGTLKDGTVTVTKAEAAS